MMVMTIRTTITTTTIIIITMIIVGSSLYANLNSPTMARLVQTLPHYAVKVEKVHYNSYRNSEIFKMPAQCPFREASLDSAI